MSWIRSLSASPPDPQCLTPKSRTLAACCGGLVCLLGITVLVGWSIRSSAIERLIKGLPVMTGWTAIGLALGGAALVCQSGQRWQRAGRALGGAMAVLGLLIVFEYLVAPLGMDELLFKASGVTDPGRPSPQTAAALVFLGSALGTVDLPIRRQWLHDGLLAATMLILVFVLVGYLFGAVDLRGVSHSNGVALHTLFGLIVLTVGTTALRPDIGLIGVMRGEGSGSMVARAAAALGCAPVVVGVVVLELLRRGTLDARGALTLFTVTMIVLVAIIAVSLTVKVRRAEAGAREVVNQLQSLFDNAPAALSLRDPEGRYLHVNRYGAEMLGTTPNELYRKFPTEPSVAGPVEADDREMAGSRQSVTREQRIRSPDGRVRDLQVVRYPVIENDEIRGFGTFAFDITEHKQTVLELELAQNRFRSAFEAAPIGMMLQGLDGTVEQVNPALCRLVARSESELLSLGVSCFIAEEERDIEASARAELQHGETGSRTLELRYKDAVGRRIPVDVHLTLVRGSDASPLHYLVQVQDVTERRRHEQKLEFLADHDPLTSLLNRRAFLRTLDLRRRRRDESGAVIVFDLDSLKQVNDAYGHYAGDALILRTAAISRAQLRSTDVIARLGGDEFAVLLPGTSPESAVDVAQNLLAAFNARTDADGGLVRPVRASIGVAAFVLAEGETPETILHRADLAMYDAKRAGGNRVRDASVAAPAAIVSQLGQKVTADHRQ